MYLSKRIEKKEHNQKYIYINVPKRSYKSLEAFEL